MKSKNQILIVHGGMTFKNEQGYLRYLRTRTVTLEKKSSWAVEFLDKKLGKAYDIIRPRMPRSEDAKYKEWKIHFERFIPLLKNDDTLIGNSLGGIFLAKYLSENKFPKKIRGVFLVCPPFDNTLSSEDLVGGFKLKSDLSLLQKNTKNLYLMFSEDDEVVPLAHPDKYRRKLPKANIITYKSKNGHFQISEFPEIIKLIKELK